MEKTPKKLTLCFIFMGLIAFSGCAVFQNLGGGAESINYALASNGATVTASDYTSGHEPATAINGVISSEGWDDGEGHVFRSVSLRSVGGYVLDKYPPQWAY